VSRQTFRLAAGLVSVGHGDVTMLSRLQASVVWSALHTDAIYYD